MTGKNRLIPVVVVGTVLWGVCGSPAQTRKNPAAKNKAPDIVMQAYRMRMEGKIDEAKTILEQALSEKPARAAAWFELARVEFHKSGVTHDLDSAQQAIERAIKLDLRNSRYHCWASRIAVYSGIIKSHGKDTPGMLEQFQKAARAAERAVTLDPDDHEARMILVSLYGNNPRELGGDARRAEQHVKTLERRSAVDGAVARCAFSLKGQPEKRIALWNEMAKMFPENSRVHENLAREHALARNVKLARVHANKALALDPKRNQILVDLTRTLAVNRNFEPAEKFAGRYLALDPPGPLSLRAWTQMALGRIQQMVGDKRASAASLEQAKELDPYCWFTMSPPPEQLFESP